MGRQQWAVRREAEARGTAQPAREWVLGPYPFGFAHSSGYGAVPPVSVLEAQGWVRLAEVPGLVGLWVMKRGNVSSTNTTSDERPRRAAVPTLADGLVGNGPRATVAELP